MPEPGNLWLCFVAGGNKKNELLRYNYKHNGTLTGHELLCSMSV